MCLAPAVTKPLAATGITAVDWSISGSLWVHNCRMRHGRPLTRALMEEGSAEKAHYWVSDPETQFTVGEVVEHHDAQPRDLLECIIHSGHEHCMRVVGCIRLDYSILTGGWTDGLPALNVFATDW